MARIKIKVNVAVLQQKSKSINIIIGSGTTAFNVVCKVIEKCSVKEPAGRFQLWAVITVRGKAHTEQLLEEKDKLADIIPLDNPSAIQFHLKYMPEPAPLTGIVRVYYQLADELETFQSLIVSPSMKTGDVIQLALARASMDQALEGTSSQFELIQRSSNNERVVQENEHPLKLASTASQLILRKSSLDEAPFDSPDKPPPLAETSNRNFSTDSEPITVISSTSSHTQSPISEVALDKGKVQLHGDLIEALHRLSTQLESGAPTSATGKERVLEQAVVEQSEILDAMQDLISSLESENTAFCDKIDRQSRTILELASWEAKAKKSERQLTELMNKQGSRSLMEYKKALAERDRQISELKAQSVVSVNTRLVAVQASLEKERLRVIELEETLSKRRNELLKLKDELSGKQSTLIDKETEVQYLKHEMKSIKKMETQQKELILKQRTVLQERDSQLISLNKALTDEKKLCEKLRKKRLSLESSTSGSIARIGDSGHFPDNIGLSSPCLFDQVIGRQITAVEVTKDDQDTEVGFSYSKMDLPVSSKVPCLIVKGVKQGSISAGRIKPGDEILEINGVSCRGPNQTKATDLLKTSIGPVKIVVARDSDGLLEGPVFHSTPARPTDSTLWATALSGKTDYQTFTTSEPLSETSSDKYVSVPTPSYTLATNQSSFSHSSTEDVSQDPTAYRSLQAEFSGLKEQLDKSEHTCLELESEIDDYRTEMESTKIESDLIEAENHELKQQVSSYEEEVTQIQSTIGELQSYLVGLQEQVSDEQQRTASYENQNKLLARELKEIKGRYEVVQDEATTLQAQVDELKEFVNENESKEHAESQGLKLSNEQLQSDLSLKEAKILELSTLLAEHTEEHEKMLTSLQDGKVSMENSVSELQEKLASVKLEHSKALSQLKSAKTLLVESERNESELKLKIRYLEQAASEANNQLTESETKRKAVESELGGYKVDLESLNLNYKTLNIGLKHTQSKLEAREQMLTRLQSEVDDLRRNSSKLNNELSQLRTDKKQLQSSLKSSELEVARLEEKLRVSNNEKDSLFQDLENSIDESTQLQVQIREARNVSMEAEQLKKQEPGLHAQVQQLETSSKEANSELENCKKKIEILKQQTATSREECKGLEALLDEVTKELAVVRAQFDSVSVAKESLEQQVVGLQSNLDTLRSELNGKDSTISKLRTNRIQIEGDLETETEKHKQAAAELSTVKQQLTSQELVKKRNEDIIASMEFMLKQEQSKMEDTQGRLVTKEKEVTVLRGQLEENTNNLLTTQSEVEALKNKLEATSKSEQRVLTQVASLKKEKKELDDDLKKLKEQLVTTEADSARYCSQVTQLQATVEHGNKERYRIQKSLDQCTKDVQERDKAHKELERQISRLESDLKNLEFSSDSMSSENADLKKCARQYEKQVDKLSAQVQASEINLEVASRNLEREKAEFSEYKEAAVFIQTELKDSQTKLEDSLAKTQRLTLDLHACNGERSKMKVNLELKQKESSQLQESLVEAQSSAAKLKSRVSDLQDERDQLIHTVEQLEQSQAEIQSSIETSERKHINNLKVERDAVAQVTKDLTDLKEKEVVYLERIQRLDRSLEEERSNVQQLMAAQNALKDSINTLGDEKEVEMLRLNRDLAESTVKCEESQREISKLQNRETSLKAEVSEKTQVIASKEEAIETLTIENKQLVTEVEVLKTTQEQMVELHTKVTALEGSLASNNQQLEQVTSQFGATEKELAEARSTVQEQQSSIADLVRVKLALVESTSELERAKRQLADESKTCQELKTERDNLLDALRKLEVDRHTESPQPSTVSVPLPEGDLDQDKVRGLLQDKEEEAHRLREYVSKLLSNVVEKAPFLLENFT